MAERADVKARRLLGEGRLIVRRVGSPDGLIVAECRGDSGQIYSLGFDHRTSEWRCTCDARSARCSHLLALQLVTVRETVA